MTDLTEKWKKGELKKNKYWVKYKNGKIDTWELSEGITIESKPEIIEVLAPVPSFKEWRELKEASDGLSKLMFKSLMNRFVKADEEKERLVEENQQLKDTISKMCMELVAPDDDMSNGLAYYFNQDLILEIHEVLK